MGRADVEVIICSDENEVAETAADIVSAVVLTHPRATLGFATGATPEPLYRLLATRSASQVDFSELRGFALDEYVGLPLTHPASYHSVLRAQVIDPLGLDENIFHIPDGLSDDLGRACDRFEELIRQAGGG